MFVVLKQIGLVESVLRKLFLSVVLCFRVCRLYFGVCVVVLKQMWFVESCLEVCRSVSANFKCIIVQKCFVVYCRVCMLYFGICVVVLKKMGFAKGCLRFGDVFL